MAKVVITVPKARYEQFGVSIPSEWDVTFVPKPYTDEELIQAVKTADYLLVGSVDRVSKEVINAGSNLKLIQTVIAPVFHVGHGGRIRTMVIKFKLHSSVHLVFHVVIMP